MPFAAVVTRPGSMPWRGTRYSLAAAARLAEIARFDCSEPPGSEYPVMTAVEFRSFFIRSAIPSRIALAMLVSRALAASKKISSRVLFGVRAGGGVMTTSVCSTAGAVGGGGGAGDGGRGRRRCRPGGVGESDDPSDRRWREAVPDQHVHVRIERGRDGKPGPADVETDSGHEHRDVLFREVASVHDRAVELADDVEERRDGNVHSRPEPEPVRDADVLVMPAGKLVGDNARENALGQHDTPLEIRSAGLDVIEVGVELVPPEVRVRDRSQDRGEQGDLEVRIRFGYELVLAADPDLARLVRVEMTDDLDAVERAAEPPPAALEFLLAGAGEDRPVFRQAKTHGGLSRPVGVKAVPKFGVAESQVPGDELLLPSIEPEGQLAHARGVRGRHCEEPDVPLGAGGYLRGSGRSDQAGEQPEERGTLNLHAISFRREPGNRGCRIE